MSEVAKLRERQQELEAQLNQARENLATLATAAAAALVEGKPAPVGELTATRERIATLEAALPEVKARLAEAGKREAEAKRAAAVKAARKARAEHGERIATAHRAITEALQALEAAADLRAAMHVSGEPVSVVAIGDKRLRFLRSDLRYLEHHWPAACGMPEKPTAHERAVQSLEGKLAALRRELQDASSKQRGDPADNPAPWQGWAGLKRSIGEQIEAAEAELKGWKAKAKEAAK